MTLADQIRIDGLSMLRILRRLRQTLIDEGNLRRYLIYAVGEIILVVIGILSAIQINNLNHQSQRNQLEKKVLTEILNDLEDDMLQIDDEIFSNNVIINSDTTLIIHFQNKRAYRDSIGVHLRYAEMYPHFDSKES